MSFKGVERTGRRRKNKYPKIPKCPSDIVLAFDNLDTYQKFAFNLRKTKPFYIDTIEVGAGAFSIFVSYEVIDLIKRYIEPKDRNYLMDGTFAVTPKGLFYQLLIIHIECEDVFPIIYVLMSGKSAALYEEVFKYIELKLFHLQPSQFMVDFEAGLRKAIRNIYGIVVQIHGCWYHFCAAIRRKLLKLELYQLTINNPIACFIYRSMLNLPLLPPELLLDGYNIIKREATSCELYKKFKPMFDYFESYWLALVSNSFIYHNLIMSVHSSSRL